MTKRAVLASAVFALTVVACSGSGGGTAPTAALRLPSIPDGTVDGVAKAFVAVHSATTPAPPAVPGTLTLRGCRWRAPGMTTFDMTWRAAAGARFPAKVRIDLERIAGDMGTGAGGDVTLSRAGDFAVTVRIAPGSPPSTTWQGDRVDWQDETTEQCVVDTPSHPNFHEVKPTLDVVTDDLHAPAGSVEDLARRVDLTNGDDPLLPLAMLLAQPGRPAVDRLYVAPRQRLASIGIDDSSNCLTVASGYGPAGGNPADDINVVQRLHCPANQVPGGTKVVGVTDDVWDVEVWGPADRLDSFIAHDLERHWFAGVKRFAPAAATYDPNKAIDAQLAESGRTAVARLAWGGGLVAAVPSPISWGEEYTDPIVATARPFGGGGSGTSCRDWAVLYESDGLRGFVLVVTQHPGYHATLTLPGRPAIALPLSPAAGTREAAVADIGDAHLVSSPVAITAPDGQPAQCVQR